MNIKLTILSLLTAMPLVSQAIPVQYFANLNGASEFPPNSSAGTGTALVTYDDAANTLRFEVTFSGLSGTTIASHVHAPTTIPFTGTSAIATELPSFTGFPLGVTSGTYDHTFDTSAAATWNPAFLSANSSDPEAAADAFALAMDAGKAYLNVHSTVVRGGEIRGFLQPVPDAGATGVFMGIAVGAIAFVRRTRF